MFIHYQGPHGHRSFSTQLITDMSSDTIPCVLQDQPPFYAVRAHLGPTFHILAKFPTADEAHRLHYLILEAIEDGDVKVFNVNDYISGPITEGETR